MLRYLFAVFGLFALVGGGYLFHFVSSWNASAGVPIVDSEEFLPRKQLWRHGKTIIVPGMDKSAVLALTGPPDSQNGDVLEWVVGQSFIDLNFLLITFDAEGRVTDVKVLQS